MSTLQMSPAVLGSLVQYTMRVPDQLIGIAGNSDSMIGSSAFELSAAFTKSPGLPFRCELNAMRVPSGDQTGDELSCELSNVNFDGVVWPASKIHTSPPPLSWR